MYSYIIITLRAQFKSAKSVHDQLCRTADYLNFVVLLEIIEVRFIKIKISFSKQTSELSDM